MLSTSFIQENLPLLIKNAEGFLAYLHQNYFEEVVSLVTKYRKMDWEPAEWMDLIAFSGKLSILCDDFNKISHIKVDLTQENVNELVLRYIKSIRTGFDFVKATSIRNAEYKYAVRWMDNEEQIKFLEFLLSAISYPAKPAELNIEGLNIALNDKTSCQEGDVQGFIDIVSVYMCMPNHETSKFPEIDKIKNKICHWLTVNIKALKAKIIEKSNCTAITENSYDENNSHETISSKVIGRRF